VSESAALGELKKILLGDHAEEFSELKDRIDHPDKRIQDMSDVLPEVIERSIKERQDELSDSIEPVIADSVKSAIKKDPEGFAEIFYPALAPSIRMMIANSIRTFAASMNQAIESTTTVKGLGWRLEAMRTGVPYSEIALRNGLEYRVEQVFLIDKESGLLVKSLINENVQGLDSDAVSAMLTAIQSFVRDSFNAQDGDNLTDMAVGDQVVWMVHGSKSVLACVIRGQAPAALRGQLIEILDNIHQTYREELIDFDGSQKLVGLANKLEPCLQLKLKKYAGERKKTPWVTIALLSALALSLLYWFAHSYEQKRLKNFVNNQFSLTAGVLPTSVFWDDGSIQVAGLIDPLAELPWKSLEDRGINRDQVVLLMKQYNSAEPEIFSKRLRQEMSVPDDIDIRLNEAFGRKFAVLTGASDVTSVVQLKERIAKVARPDVQFDVSGVTVDETGLLKFISDTIGIQSGTSLKLVGDDTDTIQLSGVADENWFLSMLRLMSSRLNVYKFTAPDMTNDSLGLISNQKFLFDSKLNLREGEFVHLKAIAQVIKRLNILLKQSDQALTIDVKGFTDGDPTNELNISLRRARVEYIIKQLVLNGVDARQLMIIDNHHGLESDVRAVRLYPRIN